MGCPSKLLIVGLVLASCTLFTENLFAGQKDLLTINTAEAVELTDVGAPVSSEVLESLSGGQSMSIDSIDMLINNMTLAADMKDNLLYSATTGINQVSNGAFANASGISTVVQNSGNQVIINNAFILNVQMQ
jgi:hypothetical protein